MCKRNVSHPTYTYKVYNKCKYYDFEKRLENVVFFDIENNSLCMEGSFLAMPNGDVHYTEHIENVPTGTMFAEGGGIVVPYSLTVDLKDFEGYFDFQNGSLTIQGGEYLKPIIHDVIGRGFTSQLRSDIENGLLNNFSLNVIFNLVGFKLLDLVGKPIKTSELGVI